MMTLQQGKFFSFKKQLADMFIVKVHPGFVCIHFLRKLRGVQKILLRFN